MPSRADRRPLLFGPLDILDAESVHHREQDKAVQQIDEAGDEKGERAAADAEINAEKRTDRNADIPHQIAHRKYVEPALRFRQISHQRLRDRLEPGAAEAVEHAEQEQQHRLLREGEPREHGAPGEQRDEHDEPAAVAIRQRPADEPSERAGERSRTRDEADHGRAHIGIPGEIKGEERHAHRGRDAGNHLPDEERQDNGMVGAHKDLNAIHG